jgi:hypothetical protein
MRKFWVRQSSKQYIFNQQQAFTSSIAYHLQEHPKEA